MLINKYFLVILNYPFYSSNLKLSIQIEKKNENTLTIQSCTAIKIIDLASRWFLHVSLTATRAFGAYYR